MNKQVKVWVSGVICVLGLLLFRLGAFSGYCAGSSQRQDPQANASEIFPQVSGPCGLQFPRDHGPHPRFRTEWWYYTGNLHAPGGERFGFQLTFFRHRISPPGVESSWPHPASPWRTSQLYFAHAAISDVASQRFYQSQAIARGALDMAGAGQGENGTRVFVKSWQAALRGQEHRIDADSEDFRFHLNLTAEKAPVAHGLSGYSRKGSRPESSSCYYSISRLSASGILTLQEKEYAVDGLAWMDHEYSSAPLEPDLVGWDWFSVQLSDGSEVMIYQLRQRDGSIHSASSGTFVDPSGQAHILGVGTYSVEVTDTWSSPHTGARYPHRWMLRVPSRRLELILEPELDDQEMRTTQPANIEYWEGSVRIEGTAGEIPVSGTGYAELTGYAGALPMF